MSHDLFHFLTLMLTFTNIYPFSQGDFGFREAIHFYDWTEKGIQNNLYLPSNDPELNS